MVIPAAVSSTPTRLLLLLLALGERPQLRLAVGEVTLVPKGARAHLLPVLADGDLEELVDGLRLPALDVLLVRHLGLQREVRRLEGTPRARA